MFHLTEMNCYWTLGVMVSYRGAVFTYTGLEWSGGFSNVGEATTALQHINTVIAFTGYILFDIKHFPRMGMVEYICFVSEIALLAVATFIIPWF